ncbi:MAG TPA: hypothetical protein VKH44_13980, partial [Pirellulaceae bacterium]|nr:hypothetical protein [Pirellulaceae bacterium]
GLEARLLAAVQAAESVPALAGVEQAARQSVLGSETTAAPVKATSAITSRRWLLVSGPIAAAALVLLGIFVVQNWKHDDQPISRDQMTSQVEGWLANIDLKTMTKPAKPPTLPVGVLGIVNRTGSIASSQGNIAAFSLQRGGNSAFLLALPTTTIYPVPALPYMRLSDISGGWKVGVWQSGGVLYVIAVPNNSGDLSDFVHQPQIG